MFSCVSSGRFYFGGLFAPPAFPLPFPARKHASFLPRALEGAACLKPGDAAPRSAPPPPAGSRAALRRRLKLGIFGCSPLPPAVPACPGPRASSPPADYSPCSLGLLFF